jgi:hypothetical protein
MAMKNIFKAIIVLLIMLKAYKAYAIDKESVLKIAEETLILSEKNDNNVNSEKIDKNLLDIKEINQLEIKIGNPLAPIDIYLFLRGIVKDDIYSLQSLLSQSETQDLPIHISKFINYSIAKKLAFALKENRIAIKTKIVIKKPKDKNSCDLFVNGNLLKDTFSFYTPAGIPIYVALYCKDNTFEIQKIRPGESQENQQVIFNHFLERQNIPAFFPNPSVVKNMNTNFQENSNIIKNENTLVTSIENNNNIKTEKTGFQFGTGIGFLKDFGTLSDDNSRNLKLPNGAILYSSSYIKYKYFLISFDYSKIILKEKMQITFIDPDTKSETKINGYVSGNGHFIRPGIGIRVPIFYLSESTKIESDLLINMTFIKGEYASSNKMGYGIQSSIGPSFELGSGFIYDFKLGMGYTFGNLNGFQLGTQMQLGYSF